MLYVLFAPLAMAIKVGYTQDDRSFGNRLIQYNVHSPEKLVVHGPYLGGKKKEAQIIKELSCVAVRRGNSEWFDATNLAIKVINKHIVSFHIDLIDDELAARRQANHQQWKEEIQDQIDALRSLLSSKEPPLRRA